MRKDMFNGKMNIIREDCRVTGKHMDDALNWLVQNKDVTDLTNAERYLAKMVAEAVDAFHEINDLATEIQNTIALEEISELQDSWRTEP